MRPFVFFSSSSDYNSARTGEDTAEGYFLETTTQKTRFSRSLLQIKENGHTTKEATQTDRQADRQTDRQT